MTDRELLECYLKGDVAAFEALLERHEQALIRYVTWLCSSRRGARELAEEVVQEVFLRLVREARELSRVQNLSAWLFRVARNLAIDTSRKERRMERRHRLAASAEAEPPQPSLEETHEVYGIVEEKLFGLPPNQRDVLMLKVQEGKSYREISEITGLTPSNVGYLIHHGLKALAGELQRAGIV